MGVTCSSSHRSSRFGKLQDGNFEPTPVILHIYDLGTSAKIAALNKLLRPIGTGAFHCGVEVHTTEWTYGGGSYEKGTGVYGCMPRTCKGHTYCESVFMGRTFKS